MPARPTWTSLLLLLLSLTLQSLALEMNAPESARVGGELNLSIRGLSAPGLLVVNSDFHTEVIVLEPGLTQYSLQLRQSGLLKLTLKSGEEQCQLHLPVEGALPTAATRLELNPRSEPVGTGQVQVLSWSWDQAYNPVSPPGALEVTFPKSRREYQQTSRELLSEARIKTTQNIGLAEVRLGEEVLVFRQVPGQPQSFSLTRQGDTVRSSPLLDTYGNLIEDGTVATWTLYRGQDIESTAQTSVLNGLVSIPFERDSSSELQLKLEVLGQSAWIDLEPEDL